MGKKSKDKGAAFERRISKQFNVNWGIKLVRTPLSGGWGHAHTKGDLVDPARRFPFFVECKNQQGWNLWSAFFDGKGPIHNWWKKAAKQAKQEQRIPLLVMGQNYQETLVLVPHTFEVFGKPHAFMQNPAGGLLCLLRFSDFLKIYQSMARACYGDKETKQENNKR